MLQAGLRDEGVVRVLAANRSFVFQNLIELDGRVGAYPLGARGYAPINTYLLKEGDDALMFDTGYAVHEQAIIHQLRSRLAPGDRLSIFPLRLNELMSVNNAAAIARQIGIEGVYAIAADVALWLDFVSVTETESEAHLRNVTSRELPGRSEILLGRQGKRVIESLQSPIRLINTRWMYDAETRVLHTSDMFSHVWRPTPDGPWVVNEENDTTTADELRSFLLNTRYWWLEGASTDLLRRAIDAVFDGRDIETIAPSYGCLLQGRSVVERHRALLDRVLSDLDRSKARSAYVHHLLER
jgi:hypothetical protein